MNKQVHKNDGAFDFSLEDESEIDEMELNLLHELDFDDEVEKELDQLHELDGWD